MRGVFLSFKWTAMKRKKASRVLFRMRPVEKKEKKKKRLTNAQWKDKN